MPIVLHVAYWLLWDLASFSSLSKHCSHPDDKDHLQCLSHHKAVHLDFTTVKVKEQKTLLHRHAVWLAFSEYVMKWWWWRRRKEEEGGDDVNWKCGCNGFMWLSLEVLVSVFALYSVLTGKCWHISGHYFQISVGRQTTAVSLDFTWKC